MNLSIKHILFSAALLAGTAQANISDDMSAGNKLNDSINKVLTTGGTTEQLFTQLAQTNPELLAQALSLLSQQPAQNINKLLAQALNAAQSLNVQVQDEILIAAVEQVKQNEAQLLTVLETAIKHSADEAQLDIIATTIATIGATEEAKLALRLSVAKRVSELGISEDILLAGYAASGADTAELEATAAGASLNTAPGSKATKISVPTATGNGGGTGGGGVTASKN